jgi:DNA-binding transcriptional LysR family regulator
MCRDSWAGVELRHLAALEAIASEGSFRGAADHLGYVQSAVSQQLAVLERIVGARLVDRASGARGVALTAAGELLLHHAGAILARIQAARADLDGLSAGHNGSVRVGAFQSVVGRVLPPVLERFAAACPGVEVTCGEWPTDAPIFDLVAEGTLDLGFAELPLEPGPFASCELLRMPAALLVAADSPLARRQEPPTLAEVARLPHIGRQTGRTALRGEERLRSLRGTLDVVFRSDLNDTTSELVAAGRGVALVWPLCVDPSDARIALVDLGEQLEPLRLGLFWHRERLLTAAAEELGEIARAVCADMQAPGAVPAAA